MRSLRSALLLASAVGLALAAGGETASARAPAPALAPVVTPAPAPCADKADCWTGKLTRGKKKPVRVECCQDGNGDYPCNRAGEDDLLIEFSGGDCRPKKNGRALTCEKGCGPSCTARFEGSRSS